MSQKGSECRDLSQHRLQQLCLHERVRTLHLRAPVVLIRARAESVASPKSVARVSHHAALPCQASNPCQARRVTSVAAGFKQAQPPDWAGLVQTAERQPTRSLLFRTKEPRAAPVHAHLPGRWLVPRQRLVAAATHFVHAALYGQTLSCNKERKKARVHHGRGLRGPAGY